MKKEIISALVSFLRENAEEPLRTFLRDRCFADVDRALRNIRSIAADQLILPSFLRLSPVLFSELARSPDPDAALNNWERFTKAIFDPLYLYSLLIDSKPILQLLVQVFGSSQFLSDVLIRNPEYFDWLIQEKTLRSEKTEEQYLAELEQSISLFKSSETRHRAVCRYRRRELLRTGARDILRLADLPLIVAELSDLATAVIKVALSICREEMEKRHGVPRVKTTSGEGKPCEFCVIAMGKLGGRELNFSSDVDLIFLYEDEGETSGRPEPGAQRAGIVTNHEFFIRLCELLINFLSEKTVEGHLYRVDTRLRPEGSSGPLARSLESYENYFFSQGRYWEKLAYLKARCIAGDGYLYEKFGKLVHEFVFTHVDPHMLSREVARLKQRIDTELLAPETQQREVKRGYGGIREIEFLTQTLQIIYHRKSPALTTRSTLDALDALENLGILPKRDTRYLRDAYVFLRTVEHRLQMNYELQRHLLPDKPEDVRRLARQMHHRGSSRRPPEELFNANYHRHTDRVHRIFDAHFRSQETPIPTVSVKTLTLLDEDADRQTLLELLQPYRLRDPATLQSIRSLARGSRDTYLASSGQLSFEQILPRLLEMCRSVPFPDSALHNLDRFLRAAKGISSFYSLTVENPSVLALLIRLFGSSDYLSRVLISHPEYFDVVVESHALAGEIPDEDDFRAMLASLHGTTEPDAAFSLLRKWKQLQLLKIGLCDVLGLCSAQTASTDLTRLAELCIAASIEIIREGLVIVYGEPQTLAGSASPQFSIVALGGFGAGEINYFSDLDLVFVYRGDGETTGGQKITHRQFFTLLGEELMQRMSAITPDGTLFKMDARLRPEGAGAPLVYPLESYTAYYERDAQLWELQSFLKARTVAGDEGLGQELIRDVSEIIKSRAREFSLEEELYSMRRKLEESVKIPSSALADFKRGSGGLVDIEFFAQYFQLKTFQLFSPVILNEVKNLAFPQPRSSPEAVAHISVAHTATALSQLARYGIVPCEDADFLTEAYAFLRNVESKIRLLFETARDLFPAAPEKLEPLAIALGYSADEMEAFRDEFLHTTRRVRTIFDKYIKPQ